MDYMQFLESLVNAESEDERMTLVKDNSASFNVETEDNSVELQGSLDEMTAVLDEANGTITTLKQEIKDRFFGKFKEEGQEDEETKEMDEETPTEEASIKDLGFGQKKY